MTLSRCPEDALDLRVCFNKAELKCVGAVIYENYIFKIFAHEIDKLAFAVGKLKIMIARVPIVAGVKCIVIGSGLICCAVVIRSVDNRDHILRKVGALAAGTRYYYHRRIGKALCAGDNSVRICAYVRFRKRPVLTEHCYAGSVSLVISVEACKLSVSLNSRVIQALYDANGFILVIERTGTCSSENRLS